MTPAPVAAHAGGDRATYVFRTERGAPARILFRQTSEAPGRWRSTIDAGQAGAITIEQIVLP